MRALFMCLRTPWAGNVSTYYYTLLCWPLIATSGIVSRVLNALSHVTVTLAHILWDTVWAICHPILLRVLECHHNHHGSAHEVVLRCSPAVRAEALYSAALTV